MSRRQESRGLTIPITALVLCGAVLTAGALSPNSTLVNNDPNADARKPVVALEKSGNPVIAWLETASGTPRAFVKRWNGKEWVKLGGALNRNPAYHTFAALIKLDAKDRPVVAWTERNVSSDGKPSGAGGLYVTRWVGKTWLPLGDSLMKNPSFAPDLPTMTLDADGNPLIAWTELATGYGGNGVFADRWDGKAWRSVDAGTLSAGSSSVSSSMDIKVTAKNLPLLAWSKQVFDPVKGPLDFNVFVGAWSGEAWQAIGGSSLNIDPEHNAGSPSFALDAQDRVTIAWMEATSGFNVLVKRWDGKAWVRLGETVNGNTGLASAPQLVLNASGNPTVAWLENAGSIKVFVKRWDGKAWQPIGTSLNMNPNVYAESLSLALDTSGQPTVAWSEEVTRTQRRVYVSHWNGKTWSALNP